ncbi:hypothetical protein Ocin01_07965 [Orchesella cincta]|uniref:Uncharacterized protein n=1 Tax=Orchesella cincta TaxID=48709 RepID=A0A1D2N1C9_ORCCI|nr:hypothetical protein Ocin01_07965 [Orchesella cincta]
MLELRKISEQYLPSLSQQFEYYWQQTGETYGLCCGKHMKAAVAGIIMTIFGIIVLSFDSERPKPGTTIVRDKIFGIEQRYFLVYFNGLLLYLSLLLLMEDEVSAIIKS